MVTKWISNEKNLLSPHLSLSHHLFLSVCVRFMCVYISHLIDLLLKNTTILVWPNCAVIFWPLATTKLGDEWFAWSFYELILFVFPLCSVSSLTVKVTPLSPIHSFFLSSSLHIGHIHILEIRYVAINIINCDVSCVLESRIEIAIAQQNNIRNHGKNVNRNQ